MRDWQASLWPGSFGGVPFLIEKVKGQFGKRVVVHEFPNRDDPFAEELGQAAQYFDIVAYIADDFADVEADDLVAMLVSYGPQMLTGADMTPQLCIFKNGARDHERDKLGYVGLSLNFVVQGASSALASGPMLGQMTLDATSALAAAGQTLLDNLTL